MTARLAMLVCCLGLITQARGAWAQVAQKDAGGPAAASAVPTKSAPAQDKDSATTETDTQGRRSWWPKAPERPSAPALPRTADNPDPSVSAPKPRDPLPFQRGLLFIPYAGISLPLGDNSGSYSAGHGIGALIGAHLTPGFSLNTELSVDFMNPGGLATESQMDVSISPLFQSQRARSLWVFGAKMGHTTFTRTAADTDDSFSATGFVWGVTFGGFVPMGPVALGGLMRFTSRHFFGDCGDNDKSNLCHDSDTRGISAALSTFNLSAAALF